MEQIAKDQIHPNTICFCRKSLKKTARPNVVTENLNTEMDNTKSWTQKLSVQKIEHKVFKQKIDANNYGAQNLVSIICRHKI